MDAAEVLALPSDELLLRARQRRDRAFGPRVTFSPKVFIPLTMLCRDKCGYCTFAQPPARLAAPYLTPDEVLAIARRHCGVARAPRARARGHRAELPAEGRHGDAQRAGLPAGRVLGCHRSRPRVATAGCTRAGTAQSERRLRRAPRCRYRRLGRRVAGDRRPCESRAALAGARAVARRNRGPRLRAGASAHGVPGVRARARAVARREDAVS